MVHSRLIPLAGCLCLLTLGPGPMAYQDAVERDAKQSTRATGTDTASPEHQTVTFADEAATSTGRLSLEDGTVLSYRATAGFIPLLNAADESEVAQIFQVTYERLDGGHPDPSRPITFVFNGGPGASSAFLLLGALGPKRIRFAANGDVEPPPARLAPNPETWLAFTDLVFVDPVGTGYSRATGGNNESQGDDRPHGGSGGDQRFWGVRQDFQAIEAFLRRYLTRTKRWDSPRYLAGESYGGFRAAGLSHYLAENDILLNGISLVSPALEFLPIRAGEMSLMPWIGMLPSLAASAIAHGKAEFPETAATEPLMAVLAEVEAFALTDYVAGLAAGDALPEAEQTALYERIAAYTGMPLTTVREAHGKIPTTRFAKDLLRDERKLLGLYDGSITLADPHRGSGRFEELSLLRFKAPFASAAQQYFRSELGFEDDLPYRILNYRVFSNWDWESGIDGGFGYPGAAEDLEAALAVNPAMRVLVTHGVYDLVTPYFATLTALRQLHLDPEARANLVFEVYEGGHMFYTREDSLKALTTAAARLYADR